MMLFARDRQIIGRLARRHVEETFSGLKATIAGSQWINPTNPYCADPVAVLATFRRKISDFWIVADEVRKARPAALAAGVI
jgi:hypothetical protein